MHHIHKYVPGIEIVPSKLSEKFRSGQSLQDTIQKFKRSINKELRFMHNYLLESQSSGRFKKESVIQFRSQLAEMEKYTDGLYLNICKEK